MGRLQILHGNFVHASSPKSVEIRPNAYMLLMNGLIVDIYDEKPDLSPDAEFVDYGERLIMQSFCDMHLHAPQYPMLGMGMDLPLLEWLQTYTFKTEARFSDPEYARKIYKKLARDLIANGTTRVCAFSSLHRESTLVLMEELENAGICGYVGKVNMDRNGTPELQESCEESISETLKWLEECTYFEHVFPILTPRFTPSCSDELMEALGKMATEKGLRVQSHLSESRSEVAWVHDLHSDCPQYWESYKKYGLFGPKTLMAHCVQSDKRERAAMRDHNVIVVHCPDSNINLVSGTAPVRAMLDEGLWVVLGSDIAGGATLPMLEVIAMAIRASKIKHMESNWTEKFLSVDEAYYLGTSSGARYFGANDGFAPGNSLHAIVVDDLQAVDTHRLNLRERFERAIYTADAENIVAVYSQGTRVKLQYRP